MLEERRDTDARFQVIDAERERIGEVLICYATERDADGSFFVSERRVGLAIDPENSSLAKLVSAYVALGGNPFDISMFLSPDSDLEVGDERTGTQPGGGVLHLKNIKYSYDQSVYDGDANLLKYQSSRSGGKRHTEKAHEVAAIMDRARGWISQEIRWKRTRIEEQIIKLCDLREQLDQEVADMVWATAGATSSSDEPYDTKRFNDSLTAGNIAYFFDSTFRIPGSYVDDFARATGSPNPDPDEATRVTYDDQAQSGAPGAVNLEVLGGFAELMNDDDNEDNTAL
jgi:hypothetical protein